MKELTENVLKEYSEISNMIYRKANDIVEYFAKVFNKTYNDVNIVDWYVSVNTVCIEWEETYFESHNHQDIPLDAGTLVIYFKDFLSDGYMKVIDGLKAKKDEEDKKETERLKDIRFQAIVRETKALGEKTRNLDPEERNKLEELLLKTLKEQ